MTDGWVELYVPLTLCLDTDVLRRMMDLAGMEQPRSLDVWVEDHRGELLAAAYRQVEGELQDNGDDLATLVFERAVKQMQEDTHDG